MRFLLGSFAPTPRHFKRTIQRYHFTHIDNVVDVVTHGLLCHNVMGRRCRRFTGVVNREIKANRRSLSVTTGPRG